MPDPASRRREERELVDRCLSGDEEAWGEFVRRVAPAGRAAAGRALEKATGAASADDLEDAV